MNDDRRAALEAIAYGDDVDVRPGDRLRALELLDDAQRRRDAHWQPQRKPDTYTELLAQLDRNVAAYVLALTYGNEPAAPELPETAAALREALDRARMRGGRGRHARRPAGAAACRDRALDARAARATRRPGGARARGSRPRLAELEASPAASSDQPLTFRPARR